MKKYGITHYQNTLDLINKFMRKLISDGSNYGLSMKLVPADIIFTGILRKMVWTVS